MTCGRTVAAPHLAIPSGAFGGGYSATGVITEVSEYPPSDSESRSDRHRIFRLTCHKCGKIDGGLGARLNKENSIDS